MDTDATCFHGASWRREALRASMSPYEPAAPIPFCCCASTSLATQYLDSGTSGLQDVELECLRESKSGPHSKPCRATLCTFFAQAKEWLPASKVPPWLGLLCRLRTWKAVEGHARGKLPRPASRRTDSLAEPLTMPNLRIPNLFKWPRPHTHRHLHTANQQARRVRGVHSACLALKRL